MNKIIISGGPSTGKSTTFELLKEEFPQAHFVPEPAEIVIRNEIEKQRKDSEYVPILPTTHYPEFSKLNIDQSVKLETDIPKNASLAIYDRSLLDDKGYAKHYGFEDFIPEIDTWFINIGFSAIFFCETLSLYEKNDIRREDRAQGQDIHNHLRSVYEESALPMTILPAVSREERIRIIKSHINELISR